jgi:serine O-acetyltransferase
VIGKNVKVYDGVTIAAFSSFHQNKSHTWVEDDVIVFSGATIYGDKTIIGKGSVIGSKVVISESVLPNQKI